MTTREWDRCRDWIEAAAATAPWPEPIEQIEKKLATDEYQFWSGNACAVITQITLFDNRKSLCVVYAGGNMSELLADIEPRLCAVAKVMGCSLMSIHGRNGWQRTCAPLGYKLAWVTLFKEIE